MTRAEEIVDLIGQCWPVVHPKSGTKGYSWHPELVTMFAAELNKVELSTEEIRALILRRRFEGQRPPDPQSVLNWIAERVKEQRQNRRLGEMETERARAPADTEKRYSWSELYRRHDYAEQFATLPEGAQRHLKKLRGEKYGTREADDEVA